MKKGYYISTMIVSVLAVALFTILAIASKEEISTAVVSLMIAGIAVGCLTVSVSGLKNNSVISGVVLEKIGILIMGFGAIVLFAALLNLKNFLEGIIIVIPAAAAGACCFKKGLDVIGKKNGRIKKLAGNGEWNTYMDKLFEKLPFLKGTLRKGASVKDIKAVETEMGVTFPEKLKGLYRANDGDDGDALCGMMLGFHFLSLESMLSEWSRSYSRTKWIPVGSDGSGNFIGVDLDPDGNGRVIYFGRDVQGKTIIAENLGALFARFTRIVCSKDFYIGEYDGEKVILLGTDDVEEGSYLTDYLIASDSVK